MTRAVYRLEPREGPWGEYSAVLIHGIASWFERGMNGELLLERTGPFVPALTFPSDLGPVVTDALKRSLEDSGLTGFSFLPVVKKRIVRSRWHEWDLSAPEPRRYPRGGAPESYVAGRTHDPDLAAAVGDLWELRPGDDERADVFRRHAAPATLVSERARSFLDEWCGDWASFVAAA